MALTLHHPFKDNPTLAGAVGAALSCTRATTAMMKDADGWLREVQSGEARFPGASFSHNLATYSDDFSNAAWVASNVTKAANSLTATAANGTALQSYTAEGGHTYLFSVTITRTTGSGNIDLTVDGGSTWETVAVTGTATRFSTYLQAPASGASSFGIRIVTSGDAIAVTEAQFEDVSGAWDSENLLLQSNQFDTTWNNTGSSETSGFSDPFGGTDAWALVEDGSNGQHFINQTVTVPEPGDYRFSMYVKAGTRSECLLLLSGVGNGAGAGLVSVYFDVAAGTVGTLSQSGSYIRDSGIESIGDGWYRVYFSTWVTSNDLSIATRLYASDTGETNSYQGVLDDEALYMYGAQLERTKPSQIGPGTYTETTTAAVTNYSPSTYIPTTTAAVSSLSGANDGLLVEEARTNFTRPSVPDNVGWSVGSGTLTENQTIAPDGSLTGALLEPDNANTSQASVFTQPVATVNHGGFTFYTASIFCKANESGWIWVITQGGDEAVSAYFDLNNGVVGDSANWGVDTVDAGIEDCGNGWYRCLITGNHLGLGNDFLTTPRVQLAETDGDNQVNRSGAFSVFIWGADHCAGAFPTSYIPTTTGTVTRNADDVTSTDVSWFNDGGPGTFYVHEVTDHINTPNEQTTYSVADGGVTRWRNYAYTSSAAARVATSALVGDSGFNSLNGVYVAGTAVRSVSAVDTNDLASYWNGSPDASPDTTVALPDGVDELLVGSVSGGSLYFNGIIKEIAYWDERLDNDTLSDLSDGTLTPYDIGDLLAWVDYTPVYYVTGRTARWRTDDGEGFIPVVTK